MGATAVISRAFKIAVVSVLLSACGPTEDRADVPELSLFDYPGSVLWFNAANSSQRESGASVSIGRESWSLPEYQVLYAQESTEIVEAPVGLGVCLTSGQPLTISPAKADSLADAPLSRLSVAFWARWTGNDQTLLTVGDPNSQGMTIEARDSQILLTQWSDEIVEESEVSLSGVEPGQWHHLVLSYEALGVMEARTGLTLHVNATGGVSTQALPLSLAALTMDFPGSPDGNTNCYNDVVVLLDGIVESTVKSLYQLAD